ncbi:macro domain-containing protein [Pontibacter sp. G13]|uniref:macro domain-containing protein n=1 Tax=Pontibacter sp. G13 TaxID=3074898 RepID=UPI00288C0156|nr:macro domain-containing protein [Pontibacter sp. G13]WNJ18351.1 macro domain-containing protein [Pontibacter sp. G13]
MSPKHRRCDGHSEIELMGSMKTVNGDLIKLAQAGEFDLIVHGCNCFCKMGAGIALGIKRAFPLAYQADLATPKGSHEKLGTISHAIVVTDHGQLIVVNAYTQFDYRGKGVKVDYQALRLAFRAIKDRFGDLRIGFPAIGAGLAGGDWDLIASIIEEELEGTDFTFVKYQP